MKIQFTATGISAMVFNDKDEPILDYNVEKLALTCDVTQLKAELFKLMTTGEDFFDEITGVTRKE